MKISQDVLAKMREAIEPLDVEDARARYRAGDFPRADKVNDLDMRYRWDLFWAVDGYRLLGDDPIVRAEITSAHIDTALRRIVAAL